MNIRYPIYEGVYRILTKEKRNYEDMDCLEVNLNVKAVIVYQGFLTQSHFC